MRLEKRHTANTQLKADLLCFIMTVNCFCKSNKLPTEITAGAGRGALTDFHGVDSYT